MTSLRVRAREVGLISGELPAGPHNAITDVGGVLVGHVTLISGEGKCSPVLARALPVDEVLKLIRR